MKFFSIVLSLCLHLIVVLLLVHFTCVSQKHTSKEEKLYKVNLVSLQEKKARKVAYVKRKPTKKTKSVPKKVVKKKEIVAKTVPEKSEEKKKPVSSEDALEGVGEKMHSEKIDEMKEKEIKERISDIRKKFEEEEKEQEKIENEQKRQEEYGSYEKRLEDFIKLSLNPAFIEKQNLKTEVKIVVDSSGNIVEMEIINSSGDEYFDNMVRDAISRSDPLLKPPAILLIGKHYLDMNLEFDPKKYEKLHN
ncbi:MAG: energy transducer TonB [Campylobacterota bacterium]|nr:energy transducer TonB [Campylobacterota bacterium]